MPQSRQMQQQEQPQEHAYHHPYHSQHQPPLGLTDVDDDSDYAAGGGAPPMGSPARLSAREAEHMSRRLDELERTSPGRANGHGSAHGFGNSVGPPARGGGAARQQGFTQAKLSAAEAEALEYEAEMLELEREGALPPQVVAQRQAARAREQADKHEVMRQKAAAIGAPPPPPLRRTTPFGSRSRPST